MTANTLREAISRAQTLLNQLEQEGTPAHTLSDAITSAKRTAELIEELETNDPDETAGSPVRAGSGEEVAAERLDGAHGVLTPESAQYLGGFRGGQLILNQSAIPRDPRRGITRRRRLLAAYGAALGVVESQAPEALQPIRAYVASLRDECADTRIIARDLRAQLEGESHE